MSLASFNGTNAMSVNGGAMSLAKFESGEAIYAAIVDLVVYHDTRSCVLIVRVTGAQT
jgi:hypothetical protein